MTVSGTPHPFDEPVRTRLEKETLLGQRGLCIWLTGLSGSGKSTVARAVEHALHQHGALCVVLDGDTVRAGLNADLGFSEVDRTENVRRAAEIARLLVLNGIVVVCAFISPTSAMRTRARTIVGANDFVEVFLDTPLEECERRDARGLYAKARAGELPGFTGIGAPYEPPASPDLRLMTSGNTAEASTQELLRFILPRIQRDQA